MTRDIEGTVSVRAVPVSGAAVLEESGLFASEGDDE